MDDRRKSIMINVLKVVFVLAWLPILWLLLSATAGALLAAVIPFPWLVSLLILLASLLLLFSVFRRLVVFAEKMFSEK